MSLAGIGAVGLPGLDVGLAGPARPDGDSAAEAAGEPAGAAGEPAGAAAEPAGAAGKPAGASRSGGAAAAVRPDQGGHGFLTSPAVTVGCRITRGIVMAFMLLIAI